MIYNVYPQLQQHLPLAVLKLSGNTVQAEVLVPLQLQQHLPLAVLKLEAKDTTAPFFKSCNSTYRLRY